MLTAVEIKLRSEQMAARRQLTLPNYSNEQHIIVQVRWAKPFAVQICQSTRPNRMPEDKERDGAASHARGLAKLPIYGIQSKVQLRSFGTLIFRFVAIFLDLRRG